VGSAGAAPPEETVVSRTDAHTPHRVRVARREVAVVPVHRCASRECDLPALDPGWAIGRVGRCYWEFRFTGTGTGTGTGICWCWMCHWHHRPEVRRGGVRAGLRTVAREWNGGDQEAGWEL
jgi:hypothetical protein